MTDSVKPGEIRSAVFAAARDKAERAAIEIHRPLDDATLDKIAADAEDASVHGWDAKKDPKTGKRLPQGIGAPGHETTNHFASIRRYEGEQRYQNAIRKMWKDNPARAAAIGLEQPERLGS